MNGQCLRTKIIKYCILTLSLILLVACGGPAKKPTASAPLDPLNAQALADFSSGKIEAAATTWATLGQQLGDPNRSYYLLRAADARLMLAQVDLAESLLAAVAPSRLDSRYLALYKAVQAELLLNSKQPEQAEQILASANTNNTELQQRIELLLNKARLLQQSPTLRAWQKFEQQASTNLLNDKYALDLMHSLDPVPTSELQQQRDQLNEELAGWVDLILIARSQYPDAESRRMDIGTWRQRNSSHRLTAEQAYRLSENFSSSLPAPARVSVLLPQSGGLTEMAAAIRDGVMSSYMDSPQKNQSQLRFQTTTGAGLNGETFASSIADLESKADHVIGPLRRNLVAEFMALKPANLPVLALNLPPQQDFTQANSNTLYFPLLPEDEARSAARRAIAAGFKKIIIIAPVSKMGDRKVDAFVESYIFAGGSILGTTRYLPTDVDHSAQLKQQLGISSSQQRGDRLQRLLGSKIGFEASIRGDIDAIFLVADPRQGRLIKPQLKFLDAGHLPVLATSMIYTGNPNPQADRDLNGIAITTNHLAIRRSAASRNKTTTISTPMPEDGRFDKYFALGADSWSVLPWLEAMQANPQVSFSGLSGQLSINPEGRLVREPVWAVFRNGSLQQLAPTLRE